MKQEIDCYRGCAEFDRQYGIYHQMRICTEQDNTTPTARFKIRSAGIQTINELLMYKRNRNSLRFSPDDPTAFIMQFKPKDAHDVRNYTLLYHIIFGQIEKEIHKLNPTYKITDEHK